MPAPPVRPGGFLEPARGAEVAAGPPTVPEKTRDRDPPPQWISLKTIEDGQDLGRNVGLTFAHHAAGPVDQATIAREREPRQEPGMRSLRGPTVFHRQEPDSGLLGRVVRVCRQRILERVQHPSGTAMVQARAERRVRRLLGRGG